MWLPALEQEEMNQSAFRKEVRFTTLPFMMNFNYLICSSTSVQWRECGQHKSSTLYRRYQEDAIGVELWFVSLGAVTTVTDGRETGGLLPQELCPRQQQSDGRI